MLRKDHAIFHYKKGQVKPDRLMRSKHAHYLPLTKQMLRVYENGIGRTRRHLHQEVEKIFFNVEDCPIRRIKAFCKLLDDAGRYDRDRAGNAYPLRKQIFETSAPYHPLVKEKDRFFEFSEVEVKEAVVKVLKDKKVIDLAWKPDWRENWREIATRLFSDVMEFHRLEEFDGYPGPGAFLARYNIAQVQAALYFAASITVWASRDFKTIIRYAKLARLMHTIRRRGERGYVIRFDGPASVLRHTRLYGVWMAKFLPALISCRGWRMHAELKMPPSGWPASLDLSERDGLKSHISPPDAFDSTVEEKFSTKWGEAPRDGWSLEREGGILHANQKVFVPDFVLRHESGRRVYLEIVGFWTRDYLEDKARTLELFLNVPIILAVHRSLTEQLPSLPFPMVTYKTNLQLKPILEILGSYL